MVSLDEIRDLLVEACGSPEAGEPGVDLLERGLLDSLALITLLEGLEDRGIELVPTQLPKETFRTAESILQAAQAAEM